MGAIQSNSNEILLESYKELKSKIEKKENLELIARGFLFFLLNYSSVYRFNHDIYSCKSKQIYQ